VKLRKWIPTVIVLVVAAGAGLYYWRSTGGDKDDRQQVLELVASVEKAIEEKKLSSLMDRVSQDYQDKSGNDRRALQQLTVAAFRDSKPFDVLVQLNDLQITGNEATVRAEVEFSVGQPVGMGDSTRLTVAAKLRREAGGWKVYEAEGWEEAAQEF
jgi:hypothetical protein